MAKGGAWVCSGEVLATGQAGRGGAEASSPEHLVQLPLTCDSESWVCGAGSLPSSARAHTRRQSRSQEPGRGTRAEFPQSV